MPLSLPAICHITFSSPGTHGQENMLPAFGCRTTDAPLAQILIQKLYYLTEVKSFNI